MCNDYRLEVEIASIMEDFDDLEINIETPEGVPEAAPREDIKMTNVAPIVRSVAHPPGNYRAVGELVNRRWSWPGKKGPVYNFRTEGFNGRPPDLSTNRCLILADGFYEFTDPEAPKQKRLDKWLFTMKDHRWFCIAGIWRSHPDVGEAFTMLTIDAGEDVAPCHHRQIIPLPRERWADWLNPEMPASEVLGYMPKGSLPAVRVYPPAADPAQPMLIS